MFDIPLAKLWLVVKPTVGLPIFFIAIALTSLAVHAAILTHTTWYPAYYNGRAKPVVVGSIAVTKASDARTFLS